MAKLSFDERLGMLAHADGSYPSLLARLAKIDVLVIDDWGLARRVVLADAGYGDVTEYRDGLTARGLEYVVGINGVQVFWAPGCGPIPPPPARPPGHRGNPCRWKDGEQKPVTALSLAMARGRKACRTVTWREGSRGHQRSCFSSVRVRSAHHHLQGKPPGNEQWLLYEWPPEEKEPTKHWLATLPAHVSLKQLVQFAKLRWRVERDYQEMKQEIGLDHFERRGWRGFHHHAVLCAIAHGFLALRRALSPRRSTPWTLPEVRRHLQQVLLQRLGTCPLCGRIIDAANPPRGPSRM